MALGFRSICGLCAGIVFIGALATIGASRGDEGTVPLGQEVHLVPGRSWRWLCRESRLVRTLQVDTNHASVYLRPGALVASVDATMPSPFFDGRLAQRELPWWSVSRAMLSALVSAGREPVFYQERAIGWPWPWLCIARCRVVGSPSPLRGAELARAIGSNGGAMPLGRYGIAIRGLPLVTEFGGCYGAVYCALYLGRRVQRGLRKRRRQCAECGYPLSGDARPCPECGSVSAVGGVS